MDRLNGYFYLRFHRCRRWIDHKIISDFNPPSTVILCKWILIDRRYRPYSPAGESLSTVDIDRDQSINRWIGQIDVGTISHHSWDHNSFVDVYLGPFLITSGIIWDHKSWSFFSWLLGKTQPGPKAKRLKRHTGTRKRKWAVSTQKAGWCAPGSLHTKYAIIGDGCDAGGHLYQMLDCFFLRELLARLRWRARLWTRSRATVGGKVTTCERGTSTQRLASTVDITTCERGTSTQRLASTADINRQPIWLWYEGTSTVDIDRFFFGMDPYWRSISTDFWVKLMVDQISTVFSCRWILIDGRHWSYSQVGESLSTVNIDCILK